MTTEIWTFAYCLVVIFVAALVRTTFGFGEGLVAMPLLIMVLPVQVAAPLMSILSAASAIALLITDWKHWHFRSDWQLLFTTLAGIPLGFLLVSVCPVAVVKLLLAVVIILFSIYNLTVRQPFLLADDRWAWAFGLPAGVLSGAYNTGGPPLVMYATLRNWPPERFRATLQGMFLPMSIAVIAGHVWSGNLTRLVGSYLLYAIPVLCLAWIVGNILHHRLRQIGFIRLVYGLLLLIGIMLFVHSLQG